MHYKKGEHVNFAIGAHEYLQPCSYSAGWSCHCPVFYPGKATRERPGLNGSTSLASCNLKKHSGVLFPTST